MTSRAGVLVSVHWGQQQLTTEFLPLRTPRDFTVGSEAGCDFAFGGARRFGLVAVDADGAAFRAPERARLRKSREGDEVVDGQAHRVQLERGDRAEFDWGPLCFSARLLDAPPPARSLGFADLTTVNIALVLLAAFGLFAVAAANRDAEGDDLDDGLGGAKTRLIKSVLLRELQKPTAATAAAESAAPKAERVKPAPGRQARRVDVRPERPAPSARERVAALFGGPGLSGVFASGDLGNELRAAASGLKTANAGTGLDGLGGGFDGTAGGLGGMGPEGIGALGTKGGRGKHPGYGVGPMLTKKRGPDPVAEPTIDNCEGCGLDKELVRKVIREHAGAYRFCYQSLLNRFPKLEGKVSMRFSIAQSGRVSAADVAQSTANNGELEACVASRTRLLQFPAQKWAGLVVVTYPFVFKQAGH